MSGQTISDRLLAARHSIAGQGLAKSVCKATTEEVIGPKKKHLDYLIHCTNEPNVSIPQLANLLIERSQNSNWVVVFKALVTTHHLMCYGNERFTQFLASNNCSFQLGNFLDKSNVAGYDMSPFIRRYAKYLNEKALSYRTVAFDFCKVKRGKEDGVLRVMAAEKLLKTLPVIQNQLDSLLEYDCSPSDLSNGVINTAFLLLFRDLIRLFACYNDGIINLLEKYFDMNKKQCKDALDFYKKFLVRMDRVAEFLKVAENVGIDKGDIPDLTKAPSSLLEALEAHLAGLEGRKPTSSSNLNSIQQQNGGGGGAAAAASASQENIDDSLKRQVLADEEAALQQFKKNTNPFLSSPTAAAPAPGAASVLDLFGGGGASDAASSQPPKASDDLLELAANPFASPAPPVPPLPAANAMNTWASSPAVQNGFAAYFANENSFAAAFGNDKGTNAADVPGAHFGATHHNPPPRPPPPSSGSPAPPPLANPLEDLLGGFDTLTSSSSSSPAHIARPQVTATPPLKPPTHKEEPGSVDFSFSSPSKQAAKGFDAFGDLLQPAAGNLGVAPAAVAAKPVAATPAAPAATSGSKVLTGDLDSSLASLAMNLNISKPQTSKPSQWNTGINKPTAAVGGMPVMQPVPMTGAAGWPGQPMMGAAPIQAAPMAPYRPMVAAVPPMGASMTPMAGMTAAYAPAQPMNPMMTTGMRPAPMMAMPTTGPFAMGMSQPVGAMGLPAMPIRPQQSQQQQQQLDPFGAL